jgi:hypothetical protein
VTQHARHRKLVSTESSHAGENMSRALRPPAALAMVALIGAGCSNAPAEDGTGTGSSGDNKRATNRDKAVKFAECMPASLSRSPGRGTPHVPSRLPLIVLAGLG